MMYSQEGEPTMLDSFMEYRPMDRTRVEFFLDLEQCVDPTAEITIPVSEGLHAQIYLNLNGVFVVDLYRIIESEKVNLWQIHFVFVMETITIEVYTSYLQYYFLPYPLGEKGLYPKRERIKDFVEQWILPIITELAPMAEKRLVIRQ